MNQDLLFLSQQDFLTWFERDFPDSFTSDQGIAVLEQRADEIMDRLNAYFTPETMRNSENAQYVETYVTAIRDAYSKRDQKQLGAELNRFKTILELM